MSVYTQKLKQIKIALGLEVKMVTAVLEDGVTTVEAEALEPGKKIFVVSESGEQAPAPEGLHITEDGTKVTVDGEGTIVSVEAPESSEEFEEEEDKVKTEEEIKEEYYKKFQEDVASIVEEKIEEILENALEEKMKSYKMEYEEVIEAIVKDLMEVKEEMSKYKTKMSKTPGDKKISTFNTDAPKDKFDAVEARIEALKNIRAGKI
jgi:hypothetical protein